MAHALRNRRWYRYLSHFCRVVFALTFLVSGFYKAIDPWGTILAMRNYLVAYDITAPDWLVTTLSIWLSCAELMMGCMLLFKVRIRMASVFAMLSMIFFTVLTFLSATVIPVEDCGCFGELVKLTPWQSFAKNAVLLVFAIFAFIGRSSFIVNMSHRMRWALVIFSWAYILTMQATALRFLPLADWGNYVVGNNIRSMVEYVPGEYRYMSVYEKDGGEAVLPVDSVPGDGWTLVRTYQELVSAGSEPEIGNFSIVDWENDIEMADELLADTGYVCIVSIEDVQTASVTHVDRINDLYDYCCANGVRFCSVSSSDEDEVLLWTKRTGAEYPMCWADKALLRSMIHSNPGLLLLKDGVVVGKWAIPDIPDVEELEKSPTLMPEVFSGPYDRIKSWLFWAVLFYVMLLLISLTDAFLAAVDYGRRWLVLRKEAAEKPVDKETSDIS